MTKFNPYGGAAITGYLSSASKSAKDKLAEEKERRRKAVEKYKKEREQRDIEDRKASDKKKFVEKEKDDDQMSFGEKALKTYELLGGDPFGAFKAPPAPRFNTPDLISEIRAKNESLRQQGAMQKMFPMYYEKMGAKEGKFVKARCKLGKNKKTRIT
jgi:hypothetical protein|tara:strand:+ start:1063 stop:1533 length:471 start_codon:yes stop_codon:yes gene_type:complete